MNDSTAYTTPITLEGQYVRLEALTLEHADELFLVARDDEIWRYMPVPTPRNVEDVRSWIQDALTKQAAGEMRPFAVIDRASGNAIGSTRFLDISARDRHVEIGWTWYGRAYWRTPINTESKYLLLKHAFEDLGCIRVALKTDSRNERSQRAIERIGAVREGILRRVVIMHDGYQRSSVYYSILDDEWARVKAELEKKLGL